MAHGEARGPRDARPELAHILKEHLREIPHLSVHQARVARDVVSCRTSALGRRLQRCDHCGRESPLYNSMIFPATACLVQNELGASRAWAFDLSAACSGFVYALTVGAQFIESGSHRKVLVIGAEVMSSILDFQDRTTCVLFGDGAGAVLFEPSEDDCGLLAFTHGTDGSGGSCLQMPAGGSLRPASHETVDQRLHYVKQEGQAVFKYAVRKMADTSVLAVEKAGLTNADIDVFIPHQANIRIIKAAQARLGLPDEKVVKNIAKYGNTTAATIPIGIYTALEENRLQKGFNLLMTSVGAGFTVGSAVLR